jgi:hypothetical protein
MEFTDKSTLEEILEFSGAVDVLVKYDVPCLGCPMARLEMQNLNIGQICAMYGIDLENLLKDLNASAEAYQAKSKINASKKGK